MSKLHTLMLQTLRYLLSKGGCETRLEIPRVASWEVSWNSWLASHAVNFLHAALPPHDCREAAGACSHLNLLPLRGAWFGKGLLLHQAGLHPAREGGRRSLCLWQERCSEIVPYCGSSGCFGRSVFLWLVSMRHTLIFLLWVTVTCKIWVFGGFLACGCQAVCDVVQAVCILY